MPHLIAALYKDVDNAQQAVAVLKKQHLGNEISIVAKDKTGIVKNQIAKEESRGVAGGAVIGGSLGALLGLFSAVTPVVVAGLGTLLVMGPLVAVWGITGGALGALAGGVMGVFTQAGIDKNVAQTYLRRIEKGDILVAVAIDHNQEELVGSILKTFHASNVYVSHGQEKV